VKAITAFNGPVVLKRHGSIQNKQKD